MKAPKPSDGKPARPRDPDMVGAEAAMQRAAQRARRRAAAHGNPIAMYENGRVVWVKVDDETPS